MCSTRCRPPWVAITSMTSICSVGSGRSNIQADAADRSDLSAVYKLYVRNRTGGMVPLRAIADVTVKLGPQVISRFNNYRAVTVNGRPKPGVSSGDALVAMDQVSRKTLPPGFGYEWSGTAYQERAAQGQTGAILGARRCCSLSCSWSRCTRAGRSRFRCCSRLRSACWVRSSACNIRGCRWICTPRSAWWC